MKRGAVIAFAVTALFAAEQAAACSYGSRQLPTREDVIQQGVEWSRADSVFIAHGSITTVTMCDALLTPVPLVALKNDLPEGPIRSSDGGRFYFSSTTARGGRVVIFARRVRFLEDWHHWREWRVIASYDIDEIFHPEATRALASAEDRPMAGFNRRNLRNVKKSLE